jgi:nonsense-mediated mRNA decay protein 3
MAKEEEEGETGRGVVGRMGGRDVKKVEEDYELFLRDLEEDPEIRGAVNLYKAREDVRMANPGSGLATGGKGRKKERVEMDVDESGSMQGEDVDEGGEADFPEIRIEELLDDFDEMTLEDSGNDQ